MNNLRNHLNIFSIVLSILFWSGCASVPALPELKPSEPEDPDPPAPTGVIAKTQQFMDVGSLGKGMIESKEFSAFLSKIPKDFNNNRLFLARVDEFAIGSPYSALNQWDLALENGLIQGLLSSGYKITEKLDFVAPRDASEYVGTSPKDAFLYARD